jgi:hypothetical protein
MKAHFKDDGEMGETHNDLEEFGWPGFPGSSFCLLTEMWGLPHASRRIGNFVLAQLWILDPMFLALLLFASYFTSSSAIHRRSREMSFIIFADVDYDR